MSTPSAWATTRHRQAEHTVVKAVSVTAAPTACQVTERSPSSNGAAPTRRTRNHSTTTPAAKRSNDRPKRRTLGTECRNATPVTRVSCTNSSTGEGTVNQRNHRPVVPVRDGGRTPGRRRRGAYYSACGRRRAARDSPRGQSRAAYGPARG